MEADFPGVCRFQFWKHNEAEMVPLATGRGSFYTLISSSFQVGLSVLRE